VSVDHTENVPPEDEHRIESPEYRVFFIKERWIMSTAVIMIQ
jgi:hypothetical protein